jgi:hypothetical protein
MHEDQDLWLSRIRLNLGFALNDDIELFIQPQDQRIFGDEASVLSDENNLDLHQGYVILRNLCAPGLELKIGRQELSYGDQRLVSPLDWSNIARAWDALKIRYGTEAGWVEAFYSVIKEVQGAEDDQEFWGIYASLRAVPDHEIDVYVFGRRLNDNSQPGDEFPPTPIFDRRDLTFGVRVKGAAFGLDYSAEGILQRGDVGDDEIRAWAAAATLGYTLDVPWQPRIGLEVTHASGDDDPTDGKIGTFDPLYTFGHYYQGFADIFAFKNGTDYVLYLKVAPARGFSLHLDLHVFRLAEAEDAWYNAFGAPIRRDTTGDAGKRIGTEIDFHFRYAYGKHLSFWGGVSRFVAGSYVDDTAGIDGDMTWGFLQATLSF